MMTLDKKMVGALCFAVLLSAAGCYAEARKFPMDEIKPAEAVLPSITVKDEAKTVETKVIEAKTPALEAKGQAAKAITPGSAIKETQVGKAKETEKTIKEEVLKVKENAEGEVKEAKETASTVIIERVKKDDGAAEGILPGGCYKKTVIEESPKTESEATVEKTGGNIFKSLQVDKNFKPLTKEIRGIENQVKK